MLLMYFIGITFKLCNKKLWIGFVSFSRANEHLYSLYEPGIQILPHSCNECCRRTSSSRFVFTCVCVKGLQGAGDSSHCHHMPHRFLLLCQLCQSWHSCDAAAWLVWLHNGGKKAKCQTFTIQRETQQSRSHTLQGDKGKISLWHRLKPNRKTDVEYNHCHFKAVSCMSSPLCLL